MEKTSSSDDESATPYTIHAQLPFALIPNTPFSIIPYQVPREPVTGIFLAQGEWVQEPPKCYTYEQWERCYTELERAISESTAATSREDPGSD
jgi:hypothetical protein